MVNQYRLFLLILLISYCGLYGWLLVATDFLPYVMDGNESFSSLWHARNLLEYGFERSYGLADESWSAVAAGHPYVHTHQGNFPRLFAILIYLLGARSIEAQIAVTTLTVGSAVVFLAYKYFSKLVNPLFALITCLLLITDYVLFSQWQVVTYRVWHGFFVFSTLHCLHGLGSKRRYLWAMATLVNFAFLFYWELVFAVFVALFAAIYTTLLYWPKWKLILVGVTCQAAGTAIAITVLGIQLVLYMGWGDALHDFYLTFLARNQASDAEDLVSNMQEFFDSRRILFWYNLQDGVYLRSLREFFNSLARYDLQPHSPFLFVLASIITGGYFWGWFAEWRANRAVEDKWRGFVTGGALLSWPVLGSLLLVLIHLVHRSARADFGPYQMIAAVGSSVVLATYLFCSWMLNRPPAEHGRIAARRISADIQARIVGLGILLALLPALVEHASTQPILTDKYFTRFLTYSLLYAWLAAHSVYYLLIRLRRADLAPRLWAENWERAETSAILLLALLLFLLLGMEGNLLFGVRITSGRLLEMIPGAVLLAGGLAVLGYFGIVWLLHDSGRKWSEWLLPSGQLGVGRTLALFLGILLLLLLLGPLLFDPRYEILWLEIMESILPSPWGNVVLIVVAVVGGLLAVFGPRAISLRLENSALLGLAMFIGSGLLAYTVVYVLSPGYVFSGYRFRLAPFTVFHTVVFLSFAVYLLVAGTSGAYRLCTSPLTTPDRASNGGKIKDPRELARSRGFARVVFSLSLTATVFVAYYWFGMQATYTRLLPPDHMSVLRRLSSPPYLGASFVANTYAAPIAAATRQWAYMDFALLEGQIVGTPLGNRLEMDDRYLWFADRETNPEYRRPEYYLCFTIQTLPTMLETIKWKRGLGEGYRGCQVAGLVKLARQQPEDNVVPRPILVEMDDEGLLRFGYARWAIMKLDWGDDAKR